MVDLQAAASLLSSLKAMGDISRAMIGLRDAEVFREKVIELQQIIIGAQQAAIDAQAAQADLKDQIRELKDQLRRRVSSPCPICGQELKTTKVVPVVYLETWVCRSTPWCVRVAIPKDGKLIRQNVEGLPFAMALR